MSGQPGLAAGVVRVRLSGAPADVAALAALLESEAVEVLERSLPYPNRREPGERVYLTVRIGSKS